MSYDYSDNFKQVILDAEDLADMEDMGGPVTPEHLWAALLHRPPVEVRNALIRLGLPVEPPPAIVVDSDLTSRFDEIRSSRIDPDSESIISVARFEAMIQRDEMVSVEHLLIALLWDAVEVSHERAFAQLDLDVLREAVRPLRPRPELGAE